MLKHFACLLLVFTAITASAKSSADRWMEVRSPHFVILTNSNEKEARHVTSQFERMRSVFHTLFPAASDDAGSPIVVLALKNKKSFQALEPEAYLAKGQLDLAGFFQSAPDKNYILLRLDAPGEHPFATVYHEYTHYMLRNGDAWLPLWLNEGLAEFYQNTDIDNNYVELGQPSADNINLLRQNRLLPLIALFQVDRSSPYYHEEQKGNIFYAESWALTHYLMIGDSEKKIHRVQDYTDLLMQHQDPVLAAQHAFGNLAKLQQALNAYVRQTTFKLYKMKTPAGLDGSSFQVEPVSTPDADAIRADVLLYVQRTRDAQALLDTVLREDPNNALAHETMGLLKFREGDLSSAKKWYGEAVQLNSQSYLAHYYFAVMSMHAGDTGDDQAIESSLRAAIKLNPKFAPSYDALAAFYASRHRNFDEAHRLNLQAILLEPNNLNYRIDTAEALVENGKYASALSVLKVAKPLARTLAEINRVQGRIQQIEDYQAALDRAQKENSEAAEHATVVTRVNGSTLTAIDSTLSMKPKYPTEAPTGPRHTVRGILRNVRCSYPAVITLSVEQSGKTVSLYSNNYFHIAFTAANFTPQGKLHPCTAIEGMKARVQYAEVSDKTIAGQILSIELSK